MKIFLSIVGSLLTTTNIGSANLYAVNLTRNIEQNSINKLSKQENINFLDLAREKSLFQIEANENNIFFDEEFTKPREITTLDLESVVNKKIKRVYVDSGKDSTIPAFDKNYDKTQSKAKNNEWYSNEIEMVSIDVTDYAMSKEIFLKNINYFQINSDVTYNFWASKFGWQWSGGKSPSSTNMTHGFPLEGQNAYHTILEATDFTHKKKESIKIEINEKWNDNILSFKLKLSAKVKWKKGSLYNHAAIVGIQNETIKLYKTNLNEGGQINHYSSIMPGVFLQPASINGAVTDVATPSLILVEADISKKYNQLQANDLLVSNVSGAFIGDLIAPGWVGKSTILMPYLYDIANIMERNIKNSFPKETFSVKVISRNNGSEMWGEIYFIINGEQEFITESNKIQYIPGASFAFAGAYEASSFMSTKH